ncbi:hypothetical protein Vadar_021007 [Vaccinium darrowii]|uniref:Uncharacterized protein n=1 Tax=Vaccinium darrowii TaxID=229202 RepID=A0ACB7YFD1_9ERIC|nr:hypothetical protein Vadar_021007 [Vaccinium darrowii]
MGDLANNASHCDAQSLNVRFRNLTVNESVSIDVSSSIVNGSDNSANCEVSSGGTVEGGKNISSCLIVEGDKDEGVEKEIEKPAAEPFSSLDEVQEIIGYNFRDPSLLHQAFTDASCPSSYKRLEYIGDSVLNLLISREDYFAYPELQPGKLTRLRAVNVDTEKLACVAAKHGVYYAANTSATMLKWPHVGASTGQQWRLRVESVSPVATSGKQNSPISKSIDSALSRRRTRAARKMTSMRRG